MPVWLTLVAVGRYKARAQALDLVRPALAPAKHGGLRRLHRNGLHCGLQGLQELQAKMLVSRLSVSWARGK
jgi:hypothetical protein